MIDEKQDTCVAVAAQSFHSLHCYRCGTCCLLLLLVVAAAAAVIVVIGFTMLFLYAIAAVLLHVINYNATAQVEYHTYIFTKACSFQSTTKHTSTRGS
jgi:uncharacterized protein YqhQ